MGYIFVPIFLLSGGHGSGQCLGCKCAKCFLSVGHSLDYPGEDVNIQLDWLVGWLVGLVGVCWVMLADHSKPGVTLVVLLDSSWIVREMKFCAPVSPQSKPFQKAKDIYRGKIFGVRFRSTDDPQEFVPAMCLTTCSEVNSIWQV